VLYCVEHSVIFENTSIYFTAVIITKLSMKAERPKLSASPRQSQTIGGGGGGVQRADEF